VEDARAGDDTSAAFAASETGQYLSEAGTEDVRQPEESTETTAFETTGGTPMDAKKKSGNETDVGYMGDIEEKPSSTAAAPATAAANSMQSRGYEADVEERTLPRNEESHDESQHTKLSPTARAMPTGLNMQQSAAEDDSIVVHPNTDDGSVSGYSAAGSRRSNSLEAAAPEDEAKTAGAVEMADELASTADVAPIEEAEAAEVDTTEEVKAAEVETTEEAKTAEVDALEGDKTAKVDFSEGAKATGVETAKEATITGSAEATEEAQAAAANVETMEEVKATHFETSQESAPTVADQGSNTLDEQETLDEQGAEESPKAESEPNVSRYGRVRRPTTRMKESLERPVKKRGPGRSRKGPPRTRSGRPPKRAKAEADDEEEQEMGSPEPYTRSHDSHVTTEASPPTKRRGRPPKKAKADADEVDEQEMGSPEAHTRSHDSRITTEVSPPTKPRGRPPK
jgi:hypothetical protein